MAAASQEPEIGLAPSRLFIPELESLRGIAVLLVFCFHVDRYMTPWRGETTPLLLVFVRMGQNGVDLFFLLSGFLLSLPFIAYGLGGRPVSLRTFFERRALRILPLYYTAVLVAVVMKAAVPSDLLRAIPYLTFFNGFGYASAFLQPYNDAWWSLATEAQFYLVLPLLGYFLRTPRGRLVGVAALALFAAAYAAMVAGTLVMKTIPGQTALTYGLLGRGPLFLWGIAAAALYHTHGVAIRARLARVGWLRAGGSDALLAACVLGLALFLQRVYAMGPGRVAGAPDQPWHIIAGAFWTAVLLLVLLFPLRAKALICNPVLARLGVLSYSIYLVHAPFMQYGLWGARKLLRMWGLFASTPATLAVVAVLALGCYGLSSLTYRVIERPFLIRKARLADAQA